MRATILVVTVERPGEVATSSVCSCVCLCVCVCVCVCTRVYVYIYIYTYIYIRIYDQIRGQSLCLLIMRSRVRFPVLPWEFSLKGKIPAVTMVWVG